MRLRCVHLLLIGLLAVPAAVFAYNNPSLEWQTLKTEHFEVHYHQGAEWTAQMVAKVAEEAHGPLTDFYQYEPDPPVHFIIRDTHDYANGAAYFYDNKVEIWATNLEFGFRGTTSWIRNVVTHEYAHIISIQSSIKFPQWLPAIYLQAIGFEKEKRPDVLQGYPNLIASYPISGVNMPPWFAEGIAQYQAPNKKYDCWDAHRDMILRCGVLDNDMLTYNEMCFFGKSGLGSEEVYDHGYGLVNYIAAEYGPDALRVATDGLKTVYRFNMDGALKKATGKKGQALYRDWRDSLGRRYETQVAEFNAGSRTGTLLNDGGYMTGAPAFSPNGRRIAFLSNKGSDYSDTSLYIMNRDGRDVRQLTYGVTSPPTFSPDGSKLVYSKKHKVDRYGSYVDDLYVYDIETEEEEQITEAARAASPAFSPDGSEIVCVINSDGTHRLVVFDTDGENRREIFHGPMGTQFYNPEYSPDGERILFGIFEGVTRDIAAVSTGGAGFEYILNTGSDERDARWTVDGKGIVFVSERSGIYNVYTLDLESGWIEQHSNVVGGAFQPDIARDGQVLVYAGYGSRGYAVFRLDDLGDPVERMDGATYATRTAGAFDECRDVRAAAAANAGSSLAMAGAGGTPESVSIASDAGGDLTGIETDPAGSPGGTAKERASFDPLPSEKYKSAYTPFQFYPRFLIWDGRARFGLLSTSFEILDKQGLLFGGSYGTNGEYDGFLSYEIRNFFPTLFVNGIVIREKTTDTGLDNDPASPSYRHAFDFDVRYDVWQTDLGLRFEFAPRYALTAQNDLSLFWTHAEYKVNIDGKEYDETGMFRTSFNGGWKYYIGNQAHLQYTFRALKRTIDNDINPRGGRQVSLHLMYAFDRLFEEDDDFEYAFRPAFSKNYYGQYTLDWREYIGLPWLDHSLRVRLFGSVIDAKVDDFFWLYLGGMDGIRGYTYFSIGGSRGVLGSITYRFPILRGIDKQLFHIYFRDLYGGVFAETANAWSSSGFKTSGYNDSAGFEMRLSLGSYYIFPTTVSVVGAYAFDPVTFTGSSIGDIPVEIRQDRGWSYYFMLGFGFEL